MKYALHFGGEEEDQKRFSICYQAIVLTDRTPNEDNEEQFIELIEKFNDVSVEADSSIGQVRLRDLDKDGGEVLLSQGEFKLLQNLVDRPIWRPVALKSRRDTKEWLKSLKPTPETEKERQRLGIVRDTEPGAESANT